MSDKSLEKSLLHGTVILTITSFIVKLLSAVYRVPYQNLVGDEGFYVYQQIYPIYGIGMTFALSGLPVYLSKIIAGAESEDEKERSIYSFFVSVCLFCFVACVFLFLTADLIAKLMGDGQLAPLIRVVALVFLVIPFLSTFRGVYQGELEMKPTALSQLADQGSRVAIILLAGYLFITLDISVYQAGELAMFGAVVGSVVGLIVLWAYKNKYPFKLSYRFRLDKEILSFSKRLFKEGGTLCLFSAYLIIFQLVDAFVVKRFLVVAGLTNLSAKIAKGVFDRGQPLVQLGLVLAVSMTAAFLPPLTKHFILKEKKAHQDLAHSYLKVSCVISSAAAIGLALVLPYVNITLFGDDKQELTLCLFVLTIYFVSMIQTYQTIYQSQNKIRYQLIGAFVGLFVKIVTTPVLTYYLKTVGASLSTLLGLLACLVVLKVYFTKKNSQYDRNNRYLIKLIINLGVMAVVLFIYRVVLEYLGWMDFNRGVTLLITFFGVFLGAVVFVFGIIKFKLLTKNEWLLLPFGRKVVKRLF